jgi:hypothetical protein
MVWGPPAIIFPHVSKVCIIVISSMSKYDVNYHIIYRMQ